MLKIALCLDEIDSCSASLSRLSQSECSCFPHPSSYCIWFDKWQ